MAHADTATGASERIRELAGRLEHQEGFGEVLVAGHAATAAPTVSLVSGAVLRSFLDG
jgi:hypothetical protein